VKNIFKDWSFRTSVILSFIFLSTGFVFLHYGLADYGLLIFVFLPVALGISLGALPNKKLSLGGLVVCLIFFLIGLVSLGLEGWVCVVMVLPIILPIIFSVAIYMHYRKKQKERKNGRLLVLLLPLFVFMLGVPVENYMVTQKNKVIDVRSEIILPYSAVRVYDAIKSVDTLIAEKSFLMKLDLPVPEKCVLEKESVGGIRTCYFSGGKIVEKITALERGKILKMDVVSYELTGRKWLGFRQAIYLFDSLGPDKCKLTRITTYTSELRPRFYWEPLEKWGIRDEHRYVFDNLKNDLKNKNIHKY
jgi:hypothetical protein